MSNSNVFEDIVKCMVEHIKLNSVETMELYDEINEMREFGTAPRNKNQFRKIISDLFLNFCFHNGLIKRVLQNDALKEALMENEEFKTCLCLWTKGKFETQPKSRYSQHILNYYFNHLNSEMKTLDLSQIKEDFGNDYYSSIPAIVKGYDKIKLEFPIQKEEELKPLRSAIDFIKIGQSIQFDIEGFQMNQLLHLLYGMCIVDVSKSEHSSFEELINHIKAYCQINLMNKVFKIFNSENGYNLVTYIRFDKDNVNYRYRKAEEYADEGKNDMKYKYTKCGIDKWKGKDVYVRPDKHTLYVEEPNDKKYILTEYGEAYEYNKLWGELNNEFKKNGISDELIIKWFDGQLLTRSTCLVGVILMCVREFRKGKLIKFKKDEMPDWKAILLDEFESTYEIRNVKVDFDFTDFKFTLNNVLDTFTDYLLN